MSAFVIANVASALSTSGLQSNSSFSSIPIPVPFYFAPRDNLIEGISDVVLSLLVHPVVFWILCGAFDLLDHSGWKWIDRYRVHEPEEIRSRNLVTRWQVIRSVAWQQVVQTVAGLLVLEDVPGPSLAHCASELKSMESTLLNVSQLGFIPNLLASMLISNSKDIAYWIYWWVIPVFQFILACFILDTYTYFCHRMGHASQTYYKHIHSIHHRLYVPFAYGALYGHWFEGFVHDALGAFIATTVAQLNPRQNIVFLTFSIIRVIDQHCGFRFPYNPLGWLSKNDAEYHAIHHQASGMKYNFSQPLFIHWDVMMGTRMTKKELEERKRKRQ